MITYRGEKFSGYNKPKRTSGKSKKFAVLAKQGDSIKLVRFGDPNMTIKKEQPKRRKSFRASILFHCVSFVTIFCTTNIVR